MATIGLCMIVKDEARVIARCLDTVRPLVDYVLVEDTGSSDGTQQLIRAWLEKEKLPGRVIDEPWRDFAYNRTHALAKLREVEGVDYALIMDADDQLVLEPGFDPAAFKAEMTEAMISVPIRLGPIHYTRPQICSNRLAFRYRGVLHEFLESPDGPSSKGMAAGMYIKAGAHGARSQNPRKYQHDAEVLETALQVETDPLLVSRYRFYLAQSYRDGGDPEKALANYRIRAGLGGWPEEVFWSLYQVGRLMESLGEPVEAVLQAYETAAQVAPWRVEALHAAARFCRLRQRFEEGYGYARRGLEIPQPAGGLFVEGWMHDYGVLDELAVNAYWAGRYLECDAACDRLLTEGKLPADQHQRIQSNKAFAKAKLAAQDAFERVSGLLRLARAKQEVGMPAPTVIAAYEAAIAADPTWAEALHEAARYCRLQDRFEDAYQFARRGLALPKPEGAPQLSAWVYEYGLLDELAVSAYWTGRYRECAEACDRLLREGRIPSSMRERVLKNRGFALGSCPVAASIDDNASPHAC